MPADKSALARAESFAQDHGVQMPILLAPMAGACPPALSIAVANAGGLGACGALLMRPDAAHRVTVFGSTRKSAATSPGVRRRSLLPSTDLPSYLRFGACLQCRENIRLLPCFPQK